MNSKTGTLPQKHALIIKLGQIGDVIMAIPSAYALHQEGFTVTWVSGKAALPVLQCYSWINVIPVDDRKILLGNVWKCAREILNLWGKIGLKNYDLCATLYYDQRFRLLALPVRARHKLILSHKSRETTLIAGRHHTDEYLRVLFGARDTCTEGSKGPVRPDRLPPAPWPTSEAQRRIVLVPGGTSNVLGQQILRRWPVENYVVLAQAMLDRGWEVILLGGAEDTWVRPYFEQMNVLDCLGTLSLPQVIRACDESDAVITHDTGPLHLAGLSGTCLVGVFGPTDPATRVPRRPYVVGIWGGQGFACRPCYDGRDFAPCHFNGCLHQVDAGLVLSELDKVLKERSMGTGNPWRIVSPRALVGISNVS